MSPKSQCLQCGSGFDSFLLLTNHIKDVHSRARRENYKVSPKVAEETEKVKEIAQKEEKQPIPAVVTPIPKPEPVPVQLSYKFSGQCPHCMVDVETICIKTDLGSYIIAWCPKEKKEIQQRRVIPIEEMDTVFKTKYSVKKLKE